MSNRDVWYIFPGLGSKFKGIDPKILNLKPFRDSIENQGKILNAFGVNLFNILFPEPCTKSSENALETVRLLATQIALVEVLKSLKIIPAGIVGHSIGEIACAYADGCCGMEDAVKIAYAHALACANSNGAGREAGAMLSVGLPAENVLERLRPFEKVFLACYNAKENVTVAGSKVEIERFRTELKLEGIFVREVECAGVAHHTELVEACAEEFRRNLMGFVGLAPKMRSGKWISTSMQGSDAGRWFSVEYLVNNMQQPVFFEQALRAIPEGAVVLEVSTESILENILGRCLPKHRIFRLGVKGHEDDILGLIHGSFKELLGSPSESQELLEKCFGKRIDEDAFASESTNQEIQCEHLAIAFFVNLILSQSESRYFRVAEVSNSQAITALATIRRCAMKLPGLQRLELNIVSTDPDSEEYSLYPQVFEIDEICIRFLNIRQLASIPLDLLIVTNVMDSSLTQFFLTNTAHVQYILVRGKALIRIPPGFKCIVRKRLLNERYVLLQKNSGIDGAVGRIFMQ